MPAEVNEYTEQKNFSTNPMCWKFVDMKFTFLFFFPLIIHLSGYDLVGESLYSGWVILFGEL